MTTLWIVGCFAILLGLTLMKTGGKGDSQVDIRYYGLGVLAQAWLVLILIGFLIIILDFYLISLELRTCEAKRIYEQA